MTGVVVLIIRALLTLSLYIFLGTALYIIWQDLRAKSELARATQVPPITISPIIEGEETPLEFISPEVIIGRDPDNNFSVQDETISSRHTRLSFHHNQWWVEDLNSTNGTFLNDDRVYTPTVVISGDELRCGQIELRITINGK